MRSQSLAVTRSHSLALTGNQCSLRASVSHQRPSQRAPVGPSAHIAAHIGRHHSSESLMTYFSEPFAERTLIYCSDKFLEFLIWLFHSVVIWGSKVCRRPVKWVLLLWLLHNYLHSEKMSLKLNLEIFQIRSLRVSLSPQTIQKHILVFFFFNEW